MKIINLEDFTLESFDYNNKEHFNMINKFDNDVEINKYIIRDDDSFSDVIDEYRYFTSDEIYNTIYMVRLLLTGEIIESLELDGKKDNLYLNYAILKKYRNNGYGSLLLKELTKKLLLEIKQISLLIKQDNDSSKKLALKTGFKRIGQDEYGYNKYQIKS